MNAPSKSRKSVLPPELAALGKRVTRVQLWLMLSILPVLILSSFISAFQNPGKLPITSTIFGLIWIAGTIFGANWYGQRMARKIGYVCPHCHEPLSKMFAKKKFVDITGRCPSCQEPLVANIAEIDAINRAPPKPRTRGQKVRRAFHIALKIFILLTLISRLVGTHSSHLSRANNLILNKDYDAAISELNQELQQNPRNIRALTQRGNAYAQKHMYVEAIQDANTALDYSPKDVDALAWRGILRAQMDDYTGAMQDCMAAISLNPSDMRGYLNRSAVYEAQYQHALAISDLDKVISLMPSEAARNQSVMGGLYALRGALNTNYGQLVAAQIDFNKAQTLDQNATELFSGRGILNYLQGSYESAITDLSHAVQEDPAEPSNVIWLHLVKAHTGQDDRADMSGMNTKLTKDKWPRAVAALYAEQAKIEDVYAQAHTGDASVWNEQKCEADFYVGEYDLQHGQRDAAQTALQLAVSECPTTSSAEKQAAILEIKTQHF